MLEGIQENSSIKPSHSVLVPDALNNDFETDSAVPAQHALQLKSSLDHEERICSKLGQSDRTGAHGDDLKERREFHVFPYIVFSKRVENHHLDPHVGSDLHEIDRESPKEASVSFIGDYFSKTVPVGTVDVRARHDESGSNQVERVYECLGYDSGNGPIEKPLLFGGGKEVQGKPVDQERVEDYGETLFWNGPDDVGEISIEKHPPSVFSIQCSRSLQGTSVLLHSRREGKLDSIYGSSESPCYRLTQENTYKADFRVDERLVAGDNKPRANINTAVQKLLTEFVNEVAGNEVMKGEELSIGDLGVPVEVHSLHKLFHLSLFDVNIELPECF